MKKMACTTIAIFLALTLVQAKIEKVDLTKGWKFTKDNKTWMPANVPSTVHLDLIDNAQIPDPYYASNAATLGWVDNTDWTYETNFTLTQAVLNRQVIEMVFEGLDTHTEVILNG